MLLRLLMLNAISSSAILSFPTGGLEASKLGRWICEDRFICHSKSNNWSRSAQHKWLMPCLTNQDRHCAPLLNRMECSTRILSLQARSPSLGHLMRTGWLRLIVLVSRIVRSILCQLQWCRPCWAGIFKVPERLRTLIKCAKHSLGSFCAL